MITPSSASIDRAVVKRAGLPAFVELVGRRKFGSGYVHSPHMRIMAEHAEALYYGEILTLLTSCPPGSMKSFVLSACLPAWIWTDDPSYTFMRASYDAANAAKLAADSKAICLTSWYRERWGDFVLERHPTRPSGAGEYWTTFDGFSLVSSIQSGRFVGRHARMMIIDDPIKGQNTIEATPDVLKKARDWYKSVATTRGAIGQEQRILAVAQRFHEDDLNGLLVDELADDPMFAHVMLPWHYEPERAGEFISKIGKDFRAREGQELFDDPKTRHAVKSALAAGKDAPVYRSQYQQDPKSAASDYFPEATHLPLDGCPGWRDCLATCITVDPTFKSGESSDYMALDVWGYAAGHFLCFYSEAVKRDFGAALEAIRRIRPVWPAMHVVIELAANGAALMNTLENEGMPGLVGIDPTGPWKGTNDASKKGRARAASYYFKSGRVHFDKSAVWFPEKSRTLKRFPAGKHDDLVDTAVMGVLWLEYTYGGGGTFVAAMKAIEEDNVKEIAASAAAVRATGDTKLAEAIERGAVAPGMRGQLAGFAQQAARKNAPVRGILAIPGENPDFLLDSFAMVTEAPF